MAILVHNQFPLRHFGLDAGKSLCNESSWGAALAALVGLGQTTFAVDYTWTNPLGGPFVLSTNWASDPPGNIGPGGVNDTVRFNLGVPPAGSYEVTGVTGLNGSLRVESDWLTLNLVNGPNPYDYQLISGAGDGILRVAVESSHMANLTLAGEPGAAMRANTAILARDPNSVGILRVDVVSAAINSEIIVGQGGHGEMIVQAGGAVQGDRFILGVGASSEGFITVGGANSRLTNLNAEMGQIDVGYLGDGELRLEAGGVITNLNGFIGAWPPGGNGQATVTGSGSMWSGREMRIGDSLGSGTLTVEDGGLVAVEIGTIFANGAVNVRGLESQFNVQQTLNIGENGDAQLLVEDGGAVTSHIGAIAPATGSNSEVTVTGPDSQWNVGQSLTIGASGMGSLNVSDGGVTLSGAITVGGGVGSSGQLIVGENGAQVRTFFLDVGINAPGTVQIDAGGTVEALQTLTLGANGQVNLHGGKLIVPFVNPEADGFDWTSGTLRLTGAGGVQISPSGLFGQHAFFEDGKSLEVALALNVADASTLFVGDSLTGGTITVAPSAQVFVGGPHLATANGLTNNGQIVVTGATTIDGPVMNAASGAITALADVTFTGAVSGQGGLYGAGTKTFSGGFAPGASPAVVEIEGDVVLGASNTLVIELSGTALGEFDRLEIGGAATIGGNLDVRLIDGFVPTIGDSFGFLFANGGFGGSFNNLLLPDLAQGMAWQLNPGGATVFLNVVAAPTFTADFDGDGDVDGDDLVQWQGDFGVNELSDADADGDSDGADFLAWQRQIGSAPVAAASGAVPEPGVAGMMLGVVGVVMVRGLGGRTRPALRRGY